MPELALTLKNIYAGKRKVFLTVLKILVSGGLLVFILQTVKFSSIIASFQQADKLLILTAFGLSFLNIYLQYRKWRMVCGVLLEENDSKKVFQSLFYGFTAGSFTPARAGEYIGRTIPFSDKPILNVSTAVLVDKLFSLFVVLIFGSIAFMLYLSFSFVSALLIVSGTGILFFILVYLIKINFPFKNYKWLKNLSKRISCLKSIDLKFSTRLGFISLLFYICFIIQFVLLIGAFSDHFKPVDYIWTANLVMFVKSIIPQITVGELGIREGASVYFLKHFGETAAAGLNASIFLFLINILFPAVTGLILLLKKK